MARTRNLKPAFFKNEVLAECEMAARLLYAGLWTLADCTGRMEYRPLRIKAELFPYDSLDIAALVEQLSDRGFVRIYEAAGMRVLEIPTFREHQHCHYREQPEGLPEPGQAPEKPGPARAEPAKGVFPEENAKPGPAPGQPGASLGPARPYALHPTPYSLQPSACVPSAHARTHASDPSASDDPWRKPGWAMELWAGFVPRWNATERAEPWRPLTPPAAWADLAATPGWLERAHEAMAQLPACRYFERPVALTQFFREGFVDRILAGEFAGKGGSVAAPF